MSNYIRDLFPVEKTGRILVHDPKYALALALKLSSVQVSLLFLAQCCQQPGHI